MHTQIDDNGVISINGRFTYRTPLALPLSGTQQIIAPYWADVDTRGTGRLFFRQTTNATLLSRTTNEIRAAFPTSQNITIQELLIATWYKVGYYYYKADKVSYYTDISMLISFHCFCIHTYLHMYLAASDGKYLILSCLL